MKKRLLLILSLLILSYTLKGQTIIPAIIAVDGTLPSQLEVTAITANNDTLEFSYFRSHFSIPKYVYNKISALPDSSVLQISICYTEFYHQSKSKKALLNKTARTFSTSINKKILFGGDVLLSITTFGKCKKAYFVDWQGNGVLKKIEYDKAFGNRHKALRRILSIYPNNDPCQ